MVKRVHDIAATDKFAALLFRGQPEVRLVGLSEGQWVQSSPDGTFVQLWQTVPPEFRSQSGGRVILDQWLATDVLCALTEEEYALLWDGGGMRTVFEAGAMIRVLVLGNGDVVRACAGCFFQTDRSNAAAQLWKLKEGAPPVRPQYWYPTPSERVELVRQWPLADVRLTLSEGVLRYASEHHLLQAKLGS